MIDFQKNQKISGFGYRRFATQHNMRQLIKVNDFFIVNDIRSRSEFEQKFSYLQAYVQDYKDSKLEINRQIKEVELSISWLKDWGKTHKVYQEYTQLHGQQKDEFLLKNEDAINIYRSSQNGLSKLYGSKIPTSKALKDKLKDLTRDLKRENPEINKIKNSLKEYKIIHKNLEILERGKTISINPKVAEKENSL